MYNYQIRLDTQKDIAVFVNIATGLPHPVYLHNRDNSFRVSGKSLLGAMYTAEWREIFCECEADIYYYIRNFVIE